MIDQAVISCPMCLRQYEIDSSSERVVAMCGECKSHFIVTVPRLCGPEENALVLEKDIEPYVNFFKEACETMARNVCIGLRFVGDPVTPGSVMRLVEKFTSDDFISNCREEGHEIAEADGSLDVQTSQALAYFTQYLPRRRRIARDMLRSAFLGVLGGIEWPDSKEKL